MDLAIQDGRAIVGLVGDLDTSAGTDAERRLAEIVATEGVSRLVLDLSRTSWLDSTGLGLLVWLRMHCQEAGIALALRDVPVRLERVLVLSGLADLFERETGSADTAASDRDRFPFPLPREAAMPAAPDARFDQIAELVRRAVGAPDAFVNFLDEHRQTMPGGTTFADDHTRAIPLDRSVCQFVVRGGAPLVVSDTRESPLLSDSGAIADGVIAYAGMPLTDATGRVVGSLCVVDSEPRVWTSAQLQTLADLADVASSELQLRNAFSRVAVSADRERLAQQLNREVFGELLSLSMLLGSAQSITTGKAGTLLDEAAHKVDDVVRRLRQAVLDRPS